MYVSDHRLYNADRTACAFRPTPNHSALQSPELLVLHSTVTDDLEGAVRAMERGEVSGSYHVVIARDGTVTQLVPFDRGAWHAGRSVWGTRERLNGWSLSIALENAGRLRREGETWVSWSGRAYPDARVVDAVHKFEEARHGWEAFTDAQVEAAMDVAQALVDEYGIGEVVGHDDISPA